MCAAQGSGSSMVNSLSGIGFHLKQKRVFSSELDADFIVSLKSSNSSVKKMGFNRSTCRVWGNLKIKNNGSFEDFLLHWSQEQTNHSNIKAK